MAILAFFEVFVSIYTARKPAIFTLAFGGFALSRLSSRNQTLTKNPPIGGFFVVHINI
jgi:hypothetical protein